jgi:hypothetical protein
VLIEHEVVGFDVAVDHALIVRELEAASGLQDVAGGQFHIEGALLLDEGAERLAFDELHAEEVRAAVLANVVDLHDVVVRELGRSVGFSGKANEKPRVACQLGLHGLDGHVAVERDLACEVDGAHASFAEEAQKLVAAQRGGQGVLADLNFAWRLGARRKVAGGVRGGAVCCTGGCGRRGSGLDLAPLLVPRGLGVLERGIHVAAAGSGGGCGGRVGPRVGQARNLRHRARFGADDKLKSLLALRTLGREAAWLEFLEGQAVLAIRAFKSHGAS